MHNSLLWLGPARPAFLVLTPACVLLGLACAQWTANALDVNRLLPTMRGNVLICILTPVLMAIGILMS